MKMLNQVKMTFASRSVNESFSRAALAAFLAQADPTVPQLADIKTAVSEAVTNCIVHAYPDNGANVYHRQPGRARGPGFCGNAELYGSGPCILCAGKGNTRYHEPSPGFPVSFGVCAPT